MPVDQNDVRELVELVGADEYVHGVKEDIRAHEHGQRLPNQPEPPIRRDDSWDQYVYFFHVGEGVTSSSGFRYTNSTWKPHGVIRGTRTRIKSVLARIRDAGDPPTEDKWNAAVITYDRASGAGDLHLFYGEDAEAWDMTPENRDRIAAQGLALFNRPGGN